MKVTTKSIERPAGLLLTDDDIDGVVTSLFDTSGSAASCLRPGYAVDSIIHRASRRVERKPRLDELDED